jgi:hypothetical protein
MDKSLTIEIYGSLGEIRKRLGQNTEKTQD